MTTPRESEHDPDPAASGGEEPPPILGAWRNLYLVVLAELLALILFCGWLARIGR